MPRKDVTIDNHISNLPESLPFNSLSIQESAENGPIYLDYNATTPILPEIQKVMNQSYQEAWANPSSTGHILGQQSKNWLNWAREEVGQLVGCSDPEKEIIFTSGGTECNNWVLNFIASIKTNSEGPPHVITSSIEHPAILQPLRALSNSGLLTYTLVKPNPLTGAVSLSDVNASIKENTVLVSIMAANNETGVIQPIEAIGQLVKEINTARKMSSQAGEKQQQNDDNKTTTFVPLFYHVDAAQILGKGVTTEPGLPNVQSWFAHYVTIVGHKFYAPRIGALYVKNGIPLSPWLHGGGQEQGKRSGTENVFDCVGLGAAAQIAYNNRSKIGNRLLSLRIYLERKLLKVFLDDDQNTGHTSSSPTQPNQETTNQDGSSTTGSDQQLPTSQENISPCPNIKINFQASKRLPNTVNCAFMTIPEGKTSADLVRVISDRVIIATGAACGHKKGISDEEECPVALGSPVLRWFL